MNRKQIIELARKAGAFPELSTTPEKDLDFLRRFAQLVAAHEREAYAKLCEENFAPPSCNTTERHLWNVAVVSCSDAIRQRGNP